MLVRLDHGMAHDLAHRRLDGMAQGHHLAPKVRIRDDADGVPAGPRHQGRTLPIGCHPARDLPDGRFRGHDGRRRATDLAHLGREEKAVAAAKEQALPLDLSGGHVHILREVELEEVLGEGRVAAHQVVQTLPGEQVADGVLHGHDGGLLVSAHEGNQPEGLPPFPVVTDFLVSAALGPDGDLDHALLDDAEGLAHRPVLLQNHGALRIELHGQALGHFPQRGPLQKLERRNLGQEPDRIVDQHRPSPDPRTWSIPSRSCPAQANHTIGSPSRLKRRLEAETADGAAIGPRAAYSIVPIPSPLEQDSA